MKRIFLTLAAVLAATLAVAPLATAQIPFAIPDMVPSAIPEPIPGGGGVGFKWLIEPSDQSVNEGAELAFSISAKRGGLPVVYSIGANDSGAVNASTGAYSWTPSYAGSGTYTVTFTATAGGKTLTKAITVTVNDVLLHWVHEPHDTSGVECYALTHTFNATSDSTITYSATGLPYNATYNSSTGAFAWTPVGLQADTSWTPTFTATVNGQEIQKQITLTCRIVDNYTTNLAAWWPFNGDTLDYSGNNNNGTRTGTVDTTDRFNRSNHAFYFDGDDYVTVANSASLNMGTDGFTICAWAKSANWAAQPQYITTCLVHGESGYRFTLNPWGADGKMRAQFSDGKNYEAITTINNGITHGAWAHIGVSVDRSLDTAYFYVNGVLLQKIGFTDGGNTSGTSVTTIGANIGGVSGLTVGSLDDVRIYRGALTADKIKQVWAWRE